MFNRYLQNVEVCTSLNNSEKQTGTLRLQVCVSNLSDLVKAIHAIVLEG